MLKFALFFTNHTQMLSLLFYLYFIIFTLLYFAVFALIYVVTVPFDKNRTVLHYFSQVWTWGYFRIIPSWRIKLEGLEKIDPDKQYVIIVNHNSMLDILLMYVLPLEFKWVAKAEVYKWPIFGWVMKMHGDIGIERGTAGGVKKMIRESRQWLSQGVSVIIFPEGSRSRDGEVHRFKEGAFIMAKENGAAILPCASVGTGTAFKNVWHVNFKNRFRLRILDPVSEEVVATTDSKSLAQQMQEKISSAVEEMKKEKVK